MDERVITGFKTTPCPRDGSTHVAVERISNNRTRVTCDCGATGTVKTPIGAIDVPTLNRLMAEVVTMHATTTEGSETR